MRMAAAMAAIFLLGSVSAVAGVFSDYSGRQLYERFCASCHGPAGFGDGAVAPSLKVMVPDLTRIYRRSGGAFPEERVRRIIDGRQAYPAHGTRLMPVWGQAFPVEEGGSAEAQVESEQLVGRLVEYLRSIQQ
ncbi:MAG: cytochrome c [Gammaproteobacteria bacterium]|nr:cytochrome c [Gammaproteobacteria bacterium]